MLTHAQIDLGLSLLAAHALADFVFQPDWMVKAKQRTPVLLLHSLIAAVLAYAAVGRWDLWLLPTLVFLSHAAIDHLKARTRGSLRVFLIDQAAHIAVVALLAWMFTRQGELTLWGNRFGVLAWRGWILVAGLVLCVRVGGILIGFWVKPYLDEIERAGIDDVGVGTKARGLTNGGRVIGQLERLLIFMLVGLGQLAGVGFLVAAKSIFRFGELKDRENRMEAEYITIGTLISFSWAFGTSLLVWWLVRGL